jgi:hypothetical protein
MKIQLECNNMKPGVIEAALIKIKEDEITDIVFEGIWFDELFSLFHSIELGKTKVSRLFLSFLRTNFSTPMYRDALCNLCRSPLSTVQLLDFSQTKPSRFMLNCCHSLLNIMTNSTFIPRLYICPPNPNGKVYPKFLQLKDFQNDYRMQLALLVLASGQQWKRGTQKSSLKKFPKDMIRLTASFIL